MLLSISASAIVGAAKKKYIIYGLWISKLEEIIGHKIPKESRGLIAALLTGSLAMTSGNVHMILTQYLRDSKDKVFTLEAPGDMYYQHIVVEYDIKKLTEILPDWKKYVQDMEDSFPKPRPVCRLCWRRP